MEFLFSVYSLCYLGATGKFSHVTFSLAVFFLNECLLVQIIKWSATLRVKSMCVCVCMPCTLQNRFCNVHVL